MGIIGCPILPYPTVLPRRPMSETRRDAWAESIEMESFQNGRLEAPHYTRPAIFRGQEVPSVLRSGDHGAVADWRREQAHEITKERRPDLIEGAFGEEER